MRRCPAEKRRNRTAVGLIANFRSSSVAICQNPFECWGAMTWDRDRASRVRDAVCTTIVP